MPKYNGESPRITDSSSDRIISIDPSFRRTGICMWDNGPSFHTIEFKAPFKKSFRNVYHVRHVNGVVGVSI